MFFYYSQYLNNLQNSFLYKTTNSYKNTFIFEQKMHNAASIQYNCLFYTENMRC